MQTETMTDMAKKKTVETLEKSIGVRVTTEERDRLDVLAEKFPLVGRSAMVRAALFVGLEAIEKQPGILLGEKPKR